VPQLGVIHRFTKEGETLKVFESPKSSFAEAFRNIRTNLQFMAPSHGAQVISVTSTVGGEGKTTLCANLGGIISMTKKKTIILNVDMRKPTLHQRFGLENKVGMSTVLSGHDTLPHTIQHTAYENLDIISSGPVPPNPSELIQSQRMEEVIAMLRKVYQVIILDTPPVGLVTDAQTLLRLSDATVYVLRAEVSKKAYLENIEKLAKGGHIHGFGIVLNSADIKRGGYGYGYGYYEEGK
jgi:capsular exopolysaccharide synthesis family protein